MALFNQSRKTPNTTNRFVPKKNLYSTEFPFITREQKEHAKKLKNLADIQNLVQTYKKKQNQNHKNSKSFDLKELQMLSSTIDQSTKDISDFALDSRNYEAESLFINLSKFDLQVRESSYKMRIINDQDKIQKMKDQVLQTHAILEFVQEQLEGLLKIPILEKTHVLKISERLYRILNKEETLGDMQTKSQQINKQFKYHLSYQQTIIQELNAKIEKLEATLISLETTNQLLNEQIKQFKSKLDQTNQLLLAQKEAYEKQLAELREKYTQLLTERSGQIQIMEKQGGTKKGKKASLGNQNRIWKIYGIIQTVFNYEQLDKVSSSIQGIELITSDTARAMQCSFVCLALPTPNLSNFNLHYNLIHDKKITATSLIGTVFFHKETIMVNDQNEPKYEQRLPIVFRCIVKNFIMVPVFNTFQESIGVLIAVNKLEENFNNIDIDHFQRLSIMLQTFMLKIDLLKKAEEEQHKSKIINDSIQKLTVCDKIEPMLQIAEGLIQNMLQCERCTIWFVEKNYMELYRQCGKDLAVIPINEGLTGQCAKTRTPIICNHTQSEKKFNKFVDDPQTIKLRMKKIIQMQKKPENQNDLQQRIIIDNSMENQGATEEDLIAEKMENFQPPNKILLVPLIYAEEEGLASYELPRGVIIATDKVSGEDFMSSDIRSLKQFGHILIRIIDIIQIIEVYYGLRVTLKKMVESSQEVEGGLLQSTTQMSWLKKSLIKFESMIKDVQQEQKNTQEKNNAKEN